jgi:hypothetical protein
MPGEQLSMTLTGGYYWFPIRDANSVTCPVLACHELGWSTGPARTLGGLGNMGCLRPDPFLCIPFSVLLHSRMRTGNELWQTAGIFLWMKL